MSTPCFSQHHTHEYCERKNTNNKLLGADRNISRISSQNTTARQQLRCQPCIPRFWCLLSPVCQCSCANSTQAFCITSIGSAPAVVCCSGGIYHTPQLRRRSTTSPRARLTTAFHSAFIPNQRLKFTNPMPSVDSRLLEEVRGSAFQMSISLKAS